MSKTKKKVKYRVAVIGCGMMGNLHAQAWNDREDSEVVAVFDPDQERAKAQAEKWGAAMADSYEEAIADHHVNVISVCTPANFHREVTCYAAERKIHVLCEKALSNRLEDAKAMKEIAEKNKIQLATSYQYRGFPRFKRFKQIIDEGILGGPLFFRFTDIREVRPKLAMHSISMNGGPIIDMGGHFFDLGCFFTGEKPEYVFARGFTYGEGKKRLETVNDKARDAGEIIVHYSGGHSLSAYINWGMPENYPAQVNEQVIGPEGSLLVEDGNAVLQRADQKTIFNDGPTPSGPTVRIADLINAIEGKSSLEVGAAEGIQALAVCIAAVESMESGKVEKVIL